MKLLTNLIFEPKGKHDPALTYTIKDTVMSPDGSKVYFALRNVPPGIALTDEDYWMLQIDLSGSKNAMDEAVAAFADYAKIVGTRVKGETAKATGNPATFLPDAGSLLQPVTVLEPKQSGSGDPYPMGGGKNLLDYEAWRKVTTERGNAAWENNGVTITATGDDAYTNVEELAIVKVTPGDTITLSWEADSNLSGMAYIFPNNIATGMVNADNAATKYLTYSVGEGVTFIGFRLGVTNAGDTIRYKNVQIEKGSTPTAFQPSSNIRPFIGYDKLDLNHAGKNLLRAVSGNVPAVAIGDNTVTFVNADDGYFFVEADSLMDGETVTLSFDVSNFSGTFELAPYNDLSYVKALTPNARNAFTFKYRAGAHDGSILIDDRERDVNDVTLSNFQLERCSVATDYAAPVMTDHTVQIGQTVYGGRMDWLTGKLVAEWAMVTLTDNHGFYLGDVGEAKRLTVVNVIPGADNEGNGENVGLYCSHYKVDPAPIGSNSVNNAICGYQQDGNVYIRDDRFNTYEEAAAYFAAQIAVGTPVQVCWKLAQPIEIQLTPHILTAVEPEQNNTLYGDGTIEVEYVKPLHVSIEERVAAALAAAAE